MDESVLSFRSIRVDNDFLEEVWTLDPRKLEYIDGSKISSYALALAQYLIYFTYQRNLVKAEQHKLNKYVDRTISITMSSDESYVKKYKTKAAATDYIISMNTDLMEAQGRLDEIHTELLQIEGMDKAVSELIATIKRELTRRENELYQVRQERRN